MFPTVSKIKFREFTTSYWSNNSVTLPRFKGDRPRQGEFYEIFCNTIYGFLFRTTSVFIPGNAETIIDFECVPTYSQTLHAQIIDMDGNVIIPQTSLKSGTIDTILNTILYGPYRVHNMNMVALGIINRVKKNTIHWKSMKRVIFISWEIKHWQTTKMRRWKETNKK